ncbi:hypothetical protein MNBD_GAMMA10-640 [hydrothermal vent metagenome]|uniref:Regulatory protein, RpfE type n=1 Tax=hydrothermal vent metagenome TaxID=652676 RepID=A0A3B0YPT0_9ZZZZ
MSALGLVIPGLLGPFSSDLTTNTPAHIEQQLKEADFQLLKKWLSKAQLKTTFHRTYYATLAGLIGAEKMLPPSQSGWCELSARYDGVDTSQGFYYRADPVHFSAQADHAILLGTQLLSPSAQEMQALINAFNQHFQQEDISLHASDPSRWYLQSDRKLAVEFNALDYSLGRDIKHFMPAGEDALWWRKILNEAQMLFFQHEVNLQREAKNQLTINGLWLWDSFVEVAEGETVGGIGEGDKTRAQKIYTDNAMATDLAGALARQYGDLALELYTDQTVYEADSLVVVEQLYGAVCYGDIDAWLEDLRGYCRAYFPQIINMLKSGQLDEVNIYPCDGRVFRVDRLQLMKFWKSANTIQSYFSAAQPGSN